MNARQVHAVLAAGVQNPDLIARWRVDPGLLRVHGVDPDALDLEALWKFAGLAVKVRHNGLRREFPLTFRLLHVAGLEIEVFAAYASSRAAGGQGYAATTEQRARDLTRFLEQWLDRRQRTHSLLWDVIRHEQALTRLGKAVPSAPHASSDLSLSRDAPSASSVPVVLGEIILHQMRCDPLAVGSTLFQRHSELDEIALGTRHYCYWRPGTPADIRILELDEFGYYALSLADGVRSAAELSHQMGGGRRPTPGFLRSLGQLGAVGILGFAPAPMSTPT